MSVGEPKMAEMPDEKTTGGRPPGLGGQLALMYKRWVLDSIVMSAFAVSKDFSRRPELYQDVTSDVAKRITDIQSRYGYDGDFPDDNQSNMLLMPIFRFSSAGPTVHASSPFFLTLRTLIPPPTHSL